MVHYIALQAVHYKPLQEVHLSRYNQAADWSHPFLRSGHQIYFLYLIPVVSAGLFVHSLWQRRSSLLKALFYVHVLVSGGRQLCSLLYPVCQLHHVCRVDAEEDVQDFRQLRPGLDSPQVVVLFLAILKFSAIEWSGSSKISNFWHADLFCDYSKFSFAGPVGGIFLYISKIQNI